MPWLESTDPLLRWDRADPELWYASSEAADIAEPIDPAEANEPTLATDAKDAALPMERTESWEQIERTEFSDQSDHTPMSLSPGPEAKPVTLMALSAGSPVSRSGTRCLLARETVAPNIPTLAISASMPVSWRPNLG